MQNYKLFKKHDHCSPLLVELLTSEELLESTI